MIVYLLSKRGKGGWLGQKAFGDMRETICFSSHDFPAKPPEMGWGDKETYFQSNLLIQKSYDARFGAKFINLSIEVRTDDIAHG
jgi:hypothetical protein